jgi:hypothetical protein
MRSRILDTVGISAAVLCLIHCIVFPLLMILPLGITHNHYIDLLFLLIGAVVVVRVTRKMKMLWLKLLFWLSILLIAVSVFADMVFEVHLPLIYIGAVGLIGGHIFNFRTHRH